MVVVVLVAELLGHLSHGPVVEAILHRLRHTLVLLVGYVSYALHPLQLAELAQHRLLHSLEGLLLILLRHIALQHHVGQDRHRRYAHHRASLVAHKLPYRHEALLPVHGQYRERPVPLHLRQYQSSQRMEGAVGVPCAPCGVVLEVGGLVHLLVAACILAVGVAVEPRSHHHVVESGVEYHLVVVAGKLGVHQSQPLVPCLACGSLHAVEGVGGLNLILEVAHRALYASAGDSQLHHHLVAQAAVKLNLAVGIGAAQALARLFAVVLKHAPLLDGLRELSHEIHRVA